jgi:hypothetical protein
MEDRTAGPVMREGESAVTEMPRLDAFDEEFGREPVAVLRGQRRKKLRFSAVIGAALGAAIITALAWPWINADGGLRSEVLALLPSIPRSTAREGAAEQVDRLVREVESLKREIADLTEARQQAVDRIASLEAGEQESRDHPTSVYWYSDLAVLNYGLQVRPGIAAPARRSITARTDARRRESGAPISLEAPQ